MPDAVTTQEPDFPHQLLTVAVFLSYPADVIVMPVEANKGDVAVVSGKIEQYKASLKL